MACNRLGAVVEDLRKAAARDPCERALDRELLERFVRERDQAAFESLLARHGPMVLNVCRRVLADQHLIEDTFQATFLILVRKAASIRHGELLANWLYGVAHRAACRAKSDDARRRSREAAVTPLLQEDPLADITARELLAVLDEELSSLPAVYRGPLVLCYLEGRTRDEAARAHGWSLATLARRLERGRDLLRRRLLRRGLSLPAAILPAMLVPAFASADTPAHLLTSTVQAAVLTVSARDGVTAGVPSGVAALADGVIRSMMLSKIKAGSLALLASLLLALGLGHVVAPSTAAGQPDAAPAVIQAPAAPDAADKSKAPLPDGEPKEKSAGVGQLIRGLDADDFRERERATKELKTLGRAILPQLKAALATNPPIEVRRRLQRLIDELGVVRLTEARRIDLAKPADALAFAADGFFVLTISDGRVQLWNSSLTKRLVEYKSPIRWTDKVVLSRDGARAAAFYEKELFIFKARSGEVVCRLTHEDDFFSACFSPDGKSLLTSNGKYVNPQINYVNSAAHLWDAADGKRLRSLDLNRPAKAVGFTSGGDILTCTGLVLQIWDNDSGRLLQKTDLRDIGFEYPAFSQDGQLCLAPTARGIGVWQTKEGARVLVTGEHPAPVRWIHLSRDSRFVISGCSGDNVGRVWDLKENRLAAELLGHTDHLLGAVISPDARYAVTTSRDRTIRLYDLLESAVSLQEWSKAAFDPTQKRIDVYERAFQAQTELGSANSRP